MASIIGCKDFIESELNEATLTHDFTLLNLYESIIKRKFCQFHLEGKEDDLATADEIKLAEKKYNTFKDKYTLLALQTLFNAKELEILLSRAEIQQLTSLIEDIKNTVNDEGVVDQVIDDKPHFVHRTLAEYCASFHIAKKMLTAPAATLKCMENVLLNVSPIFINNILDQLDGEQDKITALLKKPLFHFVLTGNHLNVIKSLMEYVMVSDYNDWSNKLDASGKTILHYAFLQWDGPFKFVKKILSYANDVIEKDILSHNSVKYSEYKNSKLVKFINIQDKDGKTALDYAMQKTYHVQFAVELLLKGASIDSLTDDHFYKLINEMLKWESESITDRSFTVDYYENKFGPIKENMFLKAPGIFKQFSKLSQLEILSYFFVHGRVKAIETLLGTIKNLKQRRRILNNNYYYQNNNDTSGYTALDLVNDSDQLSDDDRLDITKYLIEHGGIINYGNNHITEILKVSSQHDHIKTFKYFFTQENFHYCFLYLFLACHNNQHKIFKYLFENFEEEMNKNGNTALHIACGHGASLKIIKYLLQHVDINATNDKDETPLFIAINACRTLNIIEYLVTKGSYVNWEDVSGNTPLSRAVESDQEDVIKYLLQNKARLSQKASPLISDKLEFFRNPEQYNLDLVNENGYPRLHIAIKCANLKWAEFLVRYGADVNKVDIEGNAPLHLVSIHNIEIVKLLLQYGAIFDKKDKNNKTLHDMLSNSSNDNEICRQLKILSDLFTTPHLKEPFEGESIEYIVHHEREINEMEYAYKARNIQGKTFAHIVADTNDIGGMDMLLIFNHDYFKQRYSPKIILPYQDYQSISINAIDSQGNAPLHIAAQKGHDQIVTLLLENGAIFNSVNLQGETPEVVAGNNKHYKIDIVLQSTKRMFDVLENYNDTFLNLYYINETTSSINAKNQSGKTPLHLAAHSGNHKVVNFLLGNGAFVDAIDFDNNTPLHIAVNKDKFKIVKLLLKHGAIYNAKNRQGQRPLDLAHGQSCDLLEQIDTLFKGIQSDNPEVIINNLQNMMNLKYEIEIDDIITIRDNEGNTLLHYAAELREINIVKILLENGAIFNTENKCGLTPENITNDQNIITILNSIEKMFTDVYDINPKQKKLSMKIITNVRDKAGHGLLHHAVKSYNWEIIKYLVKIGAKVNLTDIDYSVTLKRPDTLDIIKYLIDKGDVNATNFKGETPLFIAINARSGLNVIEYLVTKGSNIHSQDVLDNTPLVCAVENDQEDIVHYLIEKGAHISNFE